MFITDLSKSNFNIQIYIGYIDMYVRKYICMYKENHRFFNFTLQYKYKYMYDITCTKFTFVRFVLVRLLSVQPK